jgi:transcription initiation factor TFIIF subunit beta
MQPSASTSPSLDGVSSTQLPSETTVDSTNSERRVWLVKVPDFLADAMNEILDGMALNESPNGRSECELGTVRIYAPTADAPARVTVILNRESTEELKECPKEYEMKFVKSQQKMHLFSETASKGRATAIEGRVEQECHMKPNLNEEYRAMLLQRTIEANRPRRTVQLVDNRTSAVQVGLIPHVRESELLARRRQRLGEPDQRRERLPETEVMNMLFKAFEQYPLWSLRGLSEHTQQPVVHVREILSKIANYITRGPNKNLYELKPEFK